MEPSPRNTLKLPTHTTTPKTIQTMKKYKRPGKLKPNPGGATKGAAPGEQKLLQSTTGFSQYSPPIKPFAHLS